MGLFGNNARRQGYYDEMGRLDAQRNWEAKQRNYEAKQLKKIKQPERRCPNCNKVIPMDAEICPYCSKDFRPVPKQDDNQAQQKADRYCPSCGRAIPFDANICPYCGKDFRIQK